MTDTAASMPVTTPDEEARQTHRLILGAGVFVLGWVVALAFVPLVIASSLPAAAKASLSGLLVLGVPENIPGDRDRHRGQAGLRLCVSSRRSARSSGPRRR